MRVLTALKTLTIVAALLAGETALAMAQSGPPTGDETPVAGGANGGGIAYGRVYRYPNEFRPARHLYAYHPIRHHRHRYWNY